MRYLVTGAAGFVGYHVAERLLGRGDEVLGVDNVNSYYDVRLKQARLARLAGKPGFEFREVELGDRHAVEELFSQYRPEVVIHLAAQAGVRYSIDNPHAYADSNLTGFLHVLEGCRAVHVGHLVFASSSSVYGANSRTPYCEEDAVGHPLSFYAATKIAGELMAHSYSNLYAVPATGLRFFTVYGPWGRPDMAYYQFSRDIVAGRPIRLFNKGQMLRDYTYIDDVVEAVLRVAANPPAGDPSWQSKQPRPGSSFAPWRILNLGGGRPEGLERLVDLLEIALGRAATREYAPLPLSDTTTTCADVEALERITGFRPGIPIEVGIPRFVEWFREYHARDFAT